MGGSTTFFASMFLRFALRVYLLYFIKIFVQNVHDKMDIFSRHSCTMHMMRWVPCSRDLVLMHLMIRKLLNGFRQVEDLGDGIAYCQILDAIYPGKVQLHKLNFGARTEDQKMRNLRVRPFRRVQAVLIFFTSI